MNPIRIAPGPPTEPGHYKWRSDHRYHWQILTVTTYEECRKGVTTMRMAVQRGEFIDFAEFMGGQWSTRIPDPEE